MELQPQLTSWELKAVLGKEEVVGAVAEQKRRVAQQADQGSG
jgi:hypothetical protein